MLYLTRIQKERFPDLNEYEKVKGSYKLTKEVLARGRGGMIVLHPLPRSTELPYDVDSAKSAAYSAASPPWRPPHHGPAAQGTGRRWGLMGVSTVARGDGQRPNDDQTTMLVRKIPDGSVIDHIAAGKALPS